MANSTECVELADRIGDPLLQFRALHWHSQALIESRDIVRGTQAFERESEIAQRFGHPVFTWIARFDRASLAIIHDRLEEAERLSGEALQLALENSQPDTLSFYGSQIANIRYQQGRLGEMQGMLAQVVADNPLMPAFRGLLALACAEGDLHEQAHSMLRAESAKGFRLPRDLTWLPAHSMYAHVCADVGDAEVAATLFTRLEPFSGQIASTGSSVWGEVDHALGRLAAVLGREDAIPLLDGAAELYDAREAPIGLARCRLDAARVLLSTGLAADRKRACELLELAVEGAERHGGAGVARRAAALLENARASETYAPLAEPKRPAVAPRLGGSTREPPPTLRREGDIWVFSHREGSTRLKDGIGVHYLATLLAHPGVEHHAADLQAGAAARGGGHADGLPVRATGGEGSGPILDEEAKRAYRARIEDLRDEIEQAEEYNDPERGARAREELDRSIRTGSFCVYEPLPGADARWVVEGSGKGAQRSR